MCIAFILIGEKGDSNTLPLLLLNNRDEFFDRPTEHLVEWVLSEESVARNIHGKKIYGGRDLLFGGSWLAIDSTGRFVIVLNHRSAKSLQEPVYNKSRGAIVEDFLLSNGTPLEYMTKLKLERSEYGPFNVFVGDSNTGECYYLCHSIVSDVVGDYDIIKLNKGVWYGISNAYIDNMWPKVNRGLEMLKELKVGEDVTESSHTYEKLMGVMSDNVKNEEMLPGIFSKQIEYPLSSICVEPLNFGRTYGTRTTSLIAVNHNNKVLFSELSRQDNKVYNINFQISS